MPKKCKDCTASSKRPAPYAGPRCATHHRAFVKAQKARNHELAVRKTYGLSDGEYAERYAAQGGKCAICNRAKGISRRLAVDHDHHSGSVRGLLCSVCNQYLGYIRDDPNAYLRGYNYLQESLNVFDE